MVNKKVVKSKVSNKKELKLDLKQNLENKLFVNYFDNTKYRVIMFNDNGEQVATLSIKRTDKTFSFNGGEYVTEFDNPTNFVRKDFFNKYKYFYYNVNDPNPLSFNKENNNFETKHDPNIFNQLYRTKVTKDLNNVNKGFKIDLKTILIGIVGVVIAYYFLSGGKLV